MMDLARKIIHFANRQMRQMGKRNVRCRADVLV